MLMAFLACNLSTIAVTCEDTSQSNTAHIDIERFGLRSRPDSSSEPDINDAHQVEGSPVASYYQFLSSDDNTSCSIYSNPESISIFPESIFPESIFPGFGADGSRSSNYDHAATPFYSPSNHSNDPEFTASQLDQSHSPPPTVQIPDVGSNNDLGLTYGNGYPGGTPAPDRFSIGQGQTSSHPHTRSPINHSLDRHMRPSQALPLLGMDISNEVYVRPSFAPMDNTENWAHFSPSYPAPKIYTEDVAHFHSRPGHGFPPPGADVDRGLSGGSFVALTSYSENAPQGVDVGHALLRRPYSPPDSYTEDGSYVPSPSSRDLPPQVVDVGHGPSDGPRYAQASFTEDGTHLPSGVSYNPPLPWMDASNGLSNGHYPAPARDRAHFPLNFLPSHTSAPSTSSSFFEDDLVYDTVAAASSSSAVSVWHGDTTAPSSSYKETVSTPKLRKATEKRRKNPGKFRCNACRNTFTAKHNLINHHNSHLGVKPYACEGCPSAFGVISSLVRHRKTCKQTKLS